ncbi:MULTISPECIES: hypothetical protein [Halomonadaceae]|uniref:hypothetical protein n=1 Tax=Halomonadaceae TaxID=28256 RepID=UPI0004E305CD|nr:hypothetical protein [Halomonas sp. KO116]AJY49381.1 hypothetical protein KO116_00882 [Halomonas sp. KO116]
MSVINTNITSMIGQQNDLATSMERLSSGLRINSANDGISVAQTTEGALNQVNDNLLFKRKTILTPRKI